MAERKSGPVRPPVIDLTAKPATRPPMPADDEATPGEDGSPIDSAAPETAGSDAAAESTPEAPRPPRPLARLAMPWSAISIAAIGGAVLGTLLTYAAVNVVALPDTRPAIADPSAQLAAQDQAIAELAARLAIAEAATQATETSVTTSSEAAAADLDALRQQLAAIPAPVPVDLGPLEAQVASLDEISVALISDHLKN